VPPNVRLKAAMKAEGFWSPASKAAAVTAAPALKGAIACCIRARPRQVSSRRPVSAFYEADPVTRNFRLLDLEFNRRVNCVAFR